MRLFLIGCEYAGTTTLARAIHHWAENEMGIHLGSIHDHWKIPDTIGHWPDDLDDAEQRQYLALTSKIKEAAQRHNLYYHTPHEGAGGSDQLMVGYYIEDTIYADLYYHYGGPQQAGDRSVHSKSIESMVVRFAPHMVLIHVTASPEVIRQRMREGSHPYPIVPEKDVELVLKRFEDAFHASRLTNKIAVDTSHATVEETLAEVVKQIQPYLTERDRERAAALTR